MEELGVELTLRNALSSSTEVRLERQAWTEKMVLTGGLGIG